MGDTVVALPCFRRIAASFPDAKRFLLTNAPVSAKAAPAELVLANSGLIDGVLTYKIGTRRPDVLYSLRRRLRAFSFDAAIYLAEPRTRISLVRDYLFLRSCGIQAIHGIPFRGDNFRHRLVSPGVFEHEATRLARSIRGLGPVDLDDPANWDLDLTADELAKADALLSVVADRPFLAVNLGGKAIEKDWGDHNWRAALADIHAALPDYAIVFVGSKDERDRVAALAATLDSRILNLCGCSTPRETAAVFDRCKLFLGHDSGPMHLAASRNRRCIALFGSGNRAKVWHPYGAKHVVFHEQAGVRQIPPAAIVETVKRVLGERRNADAD